MSMKKTLIYHLYCGKDFISNKANIIHYLCLKKYIDVFDEAKFTVSVDDLTDEETISYGIQWIMSLGGDFEKTISIRKNTDLYEVETFSREFLHNYENLDGMVFFGHNKGTNNFNNPVLNHESVFKWICGLYFYNLEFVEEAEGIFNGKLRAPDVFYGTFLHYFTKERQSWVHAMPNNLSGLEYCGTFYWINIPKYKNCITMGIVKEVEPDSRFFAEEYPGMFFDRYAYGAGLTSHNDFCVDARIVDLYQMNDEEWEKLGESLGDYNEFTAFINKIKNDIQR